MSCVPRFRGMPARCSLVVTYFTETVFYLLTNSRMRSNGTSICSGPGQTKGVSVARAIAALLSTNPLNHFSGRDSTAKDVTVFTSGPSISSCHIFGLAGRKDYDLLIAAVISQLSVALLILFAVPNTDLLSSAFSA